MEIGTQDSHCGRTDFWGQPTLKLLDVSTRKVDEWESSKQGDAAMAIILASVIVALGIVVSAAIHF